MHVRQLTLTNVRQFEQRTFLFQPGFNLLVGENGAGKTTLLQSLLVVLGSTKQTGRRPALIDEDIRLRTRELLIEAEVVNSDGRTFSSPRYKKSWGRRAQRTKGRDDLLVLMYGSNEATCGSFVGQRIRRHARTPEPETFRGEEWLYEAEATEVISEGRDARRGFGRSGIVREFVVRVLSRFSPKFRRFIWRLEPHDCSIRSSGGRGSMRDLLGDTPRNLSSAIMRHLQESRRPFRWPDQSRVEVDSKGYVVGMARSRGRVIPPFRELLGSSELDTKGLSFLDNCVAEIRLTPRILIQSDDGSFLLNQLSDGEKRVFSLVVDIARQLSLEAQRSAPFATTPAVVLIDEIDVHLHAKWQRMIVPTLEDLFPNCQFIATTHSPFVVQAVSEHQIQHLSGYIAGSFTDRGIEEIALKVMGIEEHQVGVRYLEMLDTAKKYFQVLEEAGAAKGSNDNELRRLRAMLRELSQRYARNPAYQAYLELHGSLTLGPE